MQVAVWYAVFVAGSIGILILFWLCRTYASPFIRSPRPLLLEYRYYCPSVTRSQAIIIALYAAANGVGMGLFTRGREEVGLRSGLMATANLIPLFMGGRTNIIADSLNVSLRTYYLLHYWIGRLVVLQALIHIGLAAPAASKGLAGSGFVVSDVPLPMRPTC
jgi:hypothetical protein